MPVTTRSISKKETETFHANTHNTTANSANRTNSANIDFIDASKEWRKNKIKHENCCFTYTRNHK